jgi:regulation of enolase protein 1 (concanavalin A-like superfamily)
VSDGSLSASKSFLLTVSSVNDAPTISNIANQTTAVSTSTALIPFTVGDIETAAGSLVVKGASSNTTLVPTANIVFGGSGSSRTVKVTPASGKTGSATITVTVTDGSASSRSDTFTLTVGTTTTSPPTIALTSPVNGANYAAPTYIGLAATVVANGHSITKVEFYRGNVLLGADSSSPYTFSWNTSGLTGTYSVTARVIYDSGSSITSAPATITLGLPAPWKTVDIGSVTAGSAISSNGLYAVQGAGNLSGTADNFRFLYQSLSGDGELKVRVSSAQDTGASGSIGVMIRESLTKGARCAFVGMSADRKFRSLRRDTTSGSMASSTSGTATPPYVWLRIVRKGSTISRYRSTDGTNWTLVASGTMSLATNIYIGMAVCSGSSTTLNTSIFSSVTAVP